jgi:hypothetical protein
VDGKCRADGEKSAADPCLGCVPAASQVAWMPVTGGPCDDGDAATVNDTCTETGCHGCKQECTGKVCGDDGCGGSCGQCALGQKCEASGTCSPDPCGGVTEVGQCMGNTLQFCSDGKLQTYDCTKYGKVCGFDETNQWYDCVDAGCQPACAGKQCGGDGCGGSCGTCPAGKKCSSDGSCSVTDCGSIDEKGCCSGQVLKYCSNGLKVFDCKEYGKDCAYDPGAGWADCMTPGTGQPAAVCP